MSLLTNKNVDIKLSAHVRFWNNPHQLHLKSKDKKDKYFGSNTAKGPKQDSQIGLWSPMGEGGEPNFYFWNL